MEFESSIASHRATPVFVEIWIIRDLQNFSNYSNVSLEYLRLNIFKSDQVIKLIVFTVMTTKFSGGVLLHLPYRY